MNKKNITLNQIKRIFLLACFVPFLGSCARFKIEKLAPNELFKIPIDRQLEHLNYPEQKGLYYEIPGRAAVMDDWFIISEPSHKTIKLFKENQLKVVISSEDNKGKPEFEKKIADGKDGKKADYQVIFNKQLNIPGAIAAGKDNDFYVVNYISASDNKSQAANSLNPDDDNSGGFYKILHFDIKGKFLHLIGRQGKLDAPFESILWMDINDDNDLWVLYKYVEEVLLDHYKNGHLVKTVTQKDCEAALFANEDKTGSHFAFQCEEMYPFYSENKILMIGRVDKLPEKKSDSDSVYVFQKRIYKLKNLKNGKVTTIFDNMNDQEDYPYIPHFSNVLIWRTVRVDRFKLAVYDVDGDLSKYIQIDLPGHRNSWRSTYATLAGKFYSLRVHNKSLHVYQWK